MSLQFARGARWPHKGPMEAARSRCQGHERRAGRFCGILYVWICNIREMHIYQVCEIRIYKIPIKLYLLLS